VSEGFKEHVKESLERVVPIAMRRMFGAVGIYSRGVFFALIDDDTLFFKVDDANRADFLAAGMEPFRPFGDARSAMKYYELPAEVLEDAVELRSWVERSLRAARGRSGRGRAAVSGRAGKSRGKSKKARKGKRG
jgi:DNA transformation protein and related proteins